MDTEETPLQKKAGKPKRIAAKKKVSKSADQHPLDPTLRIPETEHLKHQLRSLVRGVYATQKMRIAAGHRIVANFKAKLGQAPSAKEDTMSKESQDLLAKLRESYARITDGFIELRPQSKFQAAGLITDYLEYKLIHEYEVLLESETRQMKDIGLFLENFQIHREFLSKVDGIGSALAAVLISEFDPHKAKYASSYWKYAGYDVVSLEKDESTGATIRGEGRSRRKSHRVVRQYEDANGEIKGRSSITFNPWLKTKLHTLAVSFVRQVSWTKVDKDVYDNYPEDLRKEVPGKKKGDASTYFIASREGEYRRMYLDYRNRIQNDPKWNNKRWEVTVGNQDPVTFKYEQSKEVKKYARLQTAQNPDFRVNVFLKGSPAHQHAAALRYIIKQFLVELWRNQRRMAGLEIPPDYATAKLGLDHGGRPDKPAKPDMDTILQQAEKEAEDVDIDALEDDQNNLQ